MAEQKMVFNIEESSHDYCHRCQQLGDQPVKMHRSLPSYTRWVRCNIIDGDGEQEKFAVFCSDCLYEAYHSSEEITILTDGKPWKPSDGSNGIFIRNTDIKD
jgi:hypothetical protein|tara:strand:- start:227 stop:532 length:306 start_codon:yes stop_codon:yes gene_type:complete